MMASKKPDRKKAAQGRVSLVSRSLGDAARGAAAPPSREEPWRSKGGKKKK